MTQVGMIVLFPISLTFPLLSRDLQSEGNLAQVNVLKNRFSGETGKACTLHYDLETGCLQETQDDVNNDF